MKYKVRISVNHKHIYTATVQAENETQAIQKAMVEADLNNIKLPEEFWSNVTEIK